MGHPKGKWQGNQPWGNPDSKGKGEGAWPSQKGSWNPGKGSWAKGGNITNSGEEDVIGQGYSQNSQEDQYIFCMGDDASPWGTPKGKDTCTEKTVTMGTVT